MFLVKIVSCAIVMRLNFGHKEVVEVQQRVSFPYQLSVRNIC